MRIALSGARGLIGSALTAQLRAAGHQVAPLVRSGPQPAPTPADAEAIAYDPVAGSVDAQRLAACTGVVHLAGLPIAKRWSPAYKDAVRSSRVDGTAAISRALAALPAATRPRVLIAASAIGWYGDRGDAVLEETATPGSGFLAEVCRDWEAATQPASAAGVRVVHLRIGMVLAREGGALAAMLPAFRCGLGGRIGSGRQWQSWISLGDLCAQIRLCLDDERIAGAWNATAPEPVTQQVFARTLAGVLHRPCLLPLPAFAVGLLFGEMGRTLLLHSARVVPRRFLAHGFAFHHQTLAQCLADLVG